MKVTIYELLGMIKDGKAPKKILYSNYCVYELDEYNHYMYKDIDNKYIDLYDEAFNCELDEFLNDEVEIIEDIPKVQVEMTQEEYNKYLDKQIEYMEKVKNYKPNPSYLLPKEEKKIPEKLDIYDELQSLLKDNNIDEHNLHKMLKKIELNQNEIIDYLKSKGE